MFRTKMHLQVETCETAEASRGVIRVEMGDRRNPGEAARSTASAGGMTQSARSLEQELSELYRATAANLFRYGLLLTRNVGLAQDAVQETFLKYYIYRRQGELQAERAWLFRVLRNYILDQQKSHGTKMSVSLDAARDYQDGAHSPEKAFERSEAVNLALEILSPRELQCLQLRTEGFSYKEIAGILAIEPGTVGALLARSTDKIRRAFGEETVLCEAL